MGRIVGTVIGFLIVFGIFRLEGALDDAWVHRARASAESPDKAEYTIPVFKPSEQTDQYADQQDDGMWHYTWTLSTSAKPKEVIDFYRERWPDALQQTEDERYFEFVPARATPEEKSRIDIFEDEDGTAIRITQVAKQKGWLPSSDLRRIIILAALLGLVTGGWFLLRGPLAQLLARGMMEKVAAQGGTQFKTLTMPPGDVGRVFGDGNTRTLEGLGFKKVCDFTSPTVSMENYGRILQRERYTYAVLYWARINGQPYTYADFGTWFEDGSSVTTSASRYTGDFKRPDDKPLIQVPEGTPLPDELRRHEQAVTAHTKQGREPAQVDPETIFDVWREEERAMLEFRRKGGFLANDGVQRILKEVDATTAAAGHPPTPGPAAPPVPPPIHTPTPSPPVGDQRVEFRAEILSRITEAYPDLTITDRSTPLEIYVQQDAFRKMVDLESLYFLVQKPNVDREKAIMSFLSQIKNLEA